MGTTRAPTIKSVAQRAGVSTATVSYVINDGPRQVNEETRARILAAIQELNYQPNAAARNLANRKTDTIGLVVAGLGDSSFTSSNFFDYVRGISAEAESRGYNLLLFGNHLKAKERTFYQRIARSRSVDGLVLLGSSIPDDEILELAENRFPAVLLGRGVPGKDIYSVHQDYEQGAYEATRYLCLNGYRRIGFLGQALRFSYGRERLEGYKRALKENGHDFDSDLVVIPKEVRDDPSDEEVAGLLALEQPVEALLTDRGLCVLNIVRGLGKKVPEDVAIVSLDEGENSQYFNPPLTSVRAPKLELGKIAVEMLIDLIEGKSPKHRSLVLPMEFIHRESCPRRR